MILVVDEADGGSYVPDALQPIIPADSHHWVDDDVVAQLLLLLLVMMILMKVMMMDKVAALHGGWCRD